jgi:hypothetical protein
VSRTAGSLITKQARNHARQAENGLPGGKIYFTGGRAEQERTHDLQE